MQTSPSFSQGNNNDKSNEGAKVKLPKLELKSFSGNYEEWQSFWDTFESAVNRNTDISRIQKFTYLKSCVTGAAVSTITGLPLTEDNYETAIDILRDRFGKPQLLISNHMEATVGRETLLIKTFGDNPASVKECDIVQLCIRTIDAMSVYFTAYVVPVI